MMDTPQPRRPANTAANETLGAPSPVTAEDFRANMEMVAPDTHQMHCQLFEERGSMTVELVVLVPVLILFMLLAVAFGRVERARQEVMAAARAGAEAAAVMPSAGQAQLAASEAAVPSVFNQRLTCQPLNVQTNTSSFQPDGNVTVNVSCTVHLSDLLVPGFPGSTSIDESRSAPIDPYRSVLNG